MPTREQILDTLTFWWVGRPLVYVVAAPIGLIPCPTLAIVSGF